MTREPDLDQTISFGPFQLIAAQRLLLEGDRPVRLGSRALDILIALVGSAGELISKDELMARVWPNIHVQDGNLKVHVAGLRRALGDGHGENRYLVNIPGRGYRFVAPLVYGNKSLQPESSVFRPHNLPVKLTRLIGRSDVVSDLVQRLPAHRLVTIVGTAGIGKTAVALDVAEELIQTCSHGVWLIDLARIADPRLVPAALASALTLEVRSENPLPSLVATLADKQMLLVLDNCEHVIDAAAGLAADVLKGSRGVLVLATSREPLRAEGEQLLRLSPLASPPPSARLSATEALSFPAVQLFAERAAATMNDFELRDKDAASAGFICRELDGIPLAIEFAAARVDTFGVHGVAARLDDRLRLLTRGPRTNLPRHQTIGSALEWSYQLLSQEEQTVFRRLATFAGGFTLEAASTVAAGADAAGWDIADIVANLVMKSLVTADMGGREIRFRLLETMRAYALTKLAESGEADTLVKRHATYYRDLLEAAWNTSAGEDAAAEFAIEIDNIRVALVWAFAPTGNGSVGAALAAASAPIWLNMSLLTECHSWMGKALLILGAEDRGTRQEMMLQMAFAFSLIYAVGLTDEAHTALTNAWKLAERLKDVDYQLRALAVLTNYRMRLEDFQGALVLARRAEAIAITSGDPAAISTADYILSSPLGFLGRYAEALTFARRSLSRMRSVAQRAQIGRTGFDHSMWVRCSEAHTLWFQGLLDQSAQMTRTILIDAQHSGRFLTLCHALTWCGCPTALRRGDLEAAEHSIALLKSHAEKHASSYCVPSIGFEGQLCAKRGDIAAAERLLCTCLKGLREAKYEVLYTVFLSSLAEVLATAGRLDESLAAIDEVLNRAERNDVLWWMPEALRVKGEVLLLKDNSDTRAVEDHFRRSLKLAERQGALFWELRTAMCLGRLYHAHGHTRDPQTLVSSVYSRFNEGFETADLQCAARLLDEWAEDPIQ